MYSLITDASSIEVMAACDAPLVGNRKIKPVIRYAGEAGLIIVTVEEWAGPILAGLLRGMRAWYDRVAPQGRIPRGKPIVSYAGASTVRNQKRLDGVARKDRAIRRAMKAA